MGGNSVASQHITEETLALFGFCLFAPTPFHPMFHASKVIIHEI
jgi:hypothetical protein